MSDYKDHRASVSVVIATHNEGANLLRTVDGFMKILRPGDEIVVVDDGSTDGSPQLVTANHPDVQVIPTKRRYSVMSTRNLGASVAHGDVVVHTDAHVDPSPNLLDLLADALRDPTVGCVGPAITDRDKPNSPIGFGYTWADRSLGSRWLGRLSDHPYDVPILSSCCVAFRRDTQLATSGFDEGMTRWGSAEQEYSLRLWLLGYRCQVVPSATAAHMFRQNHPYEVTWSGVIFNLLRMVTTLFDTDSAAAVREYYSKHRGFLEAEAMLEESDTGDRRIQLKSDLVRDFEWFVDKFSIDVFDSEKVRDRAS